MQSVLYYDLCIPMQFLAQILAKLFNNNSNEVLLQIAKLQYVYACCAYCLSLK